MGLTTQGEEMNANDSSNQRLRMKVVALAVAAALPLASVTARADDMSDMKALVQQLSKRITDLEGDRGASAKRISDLEAQVAASKRAAAVPAAVAAAPAGHPALSTDVSGVPIDPLSSANLVYARGNSSATLYGLIEPSLSYTNHATPSGGTVSGYQTSWFSGNRLGFDFQHVLNGSTGLKVITKLESEFELPTGNMDTANVFWNRDAWAGIYSDDLGKLTFGRQNTLTRDFTNNWGDPYGAAETSLREGGYTNVNNFKQLIFYSGGPNSTRYNSAIEWKKKWDDHLITGLAYKFGSGGAGGSGDVGNGGSIPGDFSNGTGEAASVAYNRIELGGANMNLNLSYDRANVSHLIEQSWLVGGNVTSGPFRFNAGFIHFTAQQGVDNVAGTRTDNSWTTSMSYLGVDRIEFALGYQEMKGKHAGFNGGGTILSPFGNTAGVTTVGDGAKKTLYGSIMYHWDRQLDLYVAADYFKTTGDWVVGDAQGTGMKFGKGQPFDSQTEIAVGGRFKF
jgi:predicted porin